MKLSKWAKKMSVIAKKDMADLRAGKLVLLDKDGNIIQIEDYLALVRAEYDKHDKAARQRLIAS